MNLKELNPLIKVYGNTEFRGDCALEDAELMTFFNELNLHIVTLHESQYTPTMRV